jgi:glycosyltransferase involved in cell wall biosynthesis
MRILHVSSEYPPLQVFGLGRYVSDLSRELAKQGHEVHVLTNSIGGPDQEIEERGVKIHRVDFPPPPKPPSRGGPIMAFNLHLQQRSMLLGKEVVGEPELIVSHDWLTALAAHRISKRWHIPHVWTVHDTAYGKHAGVFHEPEDELAFRLETWATQAADLILVNSTSIGEEVRAHYSGDRKKMDLLHPGLDGEKYASLPSPTRRAAFRGTFAQPGEVLVTYSGRLDFEKGIDTLVNAFSLFKARVQNAKLAIAGIGKLQPMIEEHLRRLKLERSVELCGYLEEDVLRSFHLASDIHVCPSNYEPFGLVAAEAMAVGTPVVVSATGGLTDIVTNPEVGKTVPPGNPERLAAALLELAGDPQLRKRMGQKGRDHALRHFSWSKLATRAVELYSAALKGGKAA